MSRNVDLRQTVGDRLRKIRLQRGLTGEDVHAAIGISRGTLWRWEQGKTEGMPASKLAQLATLYRVSLDVIWFGDVSPATGDEGDEREPTGGAG